MKSIICAVLFAFSVSAVAAGTNTLTWDYAPADEANITNFSVEGKQAACAAATPAFTEIIQVPKTARTYVHPNLVEGATYCYRVRAVGPGGASGYSNTVARTIPFTVPAAPSNLQVVGGP